MQTRDQEKSGATAKMKIQTHRIDDIQQVENSRINYREGDLAELMYSLKRNGLLQPVSVRYLDDGSPEVVCGNRRLEAARRLGWESVPTVEVIAKDDLERDTLNLVENLDRQNLTLAEEGRAYKGMRDGHGLTLAELAARLGKTKSRIQLAIDVVSHVPEKLGIKIVNARGGAKRSGEISASTYAAVAGVRKSQGLQEKQFNELVHYASQKKVGVANISQVGAALRLGVPLSKAIEASEQFERLQFDLFVDRKKRIKVEKKYGKSIYKRVYEILESHKELGVSRRMTSARMDLRMKPLKSKTAGENNAKT